MAFYIRNLGKGIEMQYKSEGGHFTLTGSLILERLGNFMVIAGKQVTLLFNILKSSCKPLKNAKTVQQCLGGRN